MRPGCGKREARQGAASAQRAAGGRDPGALRVRCGCAAMSSDELRCALDGVGEPAGKDNNPQLPGCSHLHISASRGKKF